MTDNFRNILSVLSNNNNIGDRAVPDTENTRRAVSQVFRVFINDKQVTGKMHVDIHMNYCGYSLLFDKSYAVNEIQTIRIELEYPKSQS